MSAPDEACDLDPRVVEILAENAALTAQVAELRAALEAAAVQREALDTLLHDFWDEVLDQYADYDSDSGMAGPCMEAIMVAAKPASKYIYSDERLSWRKTRASAPSTTGTGK